MNQLIPAILVKDKETFQHHVDALQDEFSEFQIDVMDGAFVPNRTWFDAEVLRGMKAAPQFELHLMVMDPTSVIQTVLDLPNIKRIIWHIESTANHPALIHAIHSKKKEAGLAINPSTPRSLLAALYDDVDEVLILGAEPGFSGRALDPRMFARATRIHEENPSLALGFDVDVDAESIPNLKKAGISRFCIGSAIYKSDDPLAAALELRSMIS